MSCRDRVKQLIQLAMTSKITPAASFDSVEETLHYLNDLKDELAACDDLKRARAIISLMADQVLAAEMLVSMGENWAASAPNLPIEGQLDIANNAMMSVAQAYWAKKYFDADPALRDRLFVAAANLSDSITNMEATDAISYWKTGSLKMDADHVAHCMAEKFYKGTENGLATKLLYNAAANQLTDLTDTNAPFRHIHAAIQVSPAHAVEYLDLAINVANNLDEQTDHPDRRKWLMTKYRDTLLTVVDEALKRECGLNPQQRQEILNRVPYIYEQIFQGWADSDGFVATKEGIHASECKTVFETAYASKGWQLPKIKVQKGPFVYQKLPTDSWVYDSMPQPKSTATHYALCTAQQRAPILSLFSVKQTPTHFNWGGPHLRVAVRGTEKGGYEASIGQAVFGGTGGVLNGYKWWASFGGAFKTAEEALAVLQEQYDLYDQASELDSVRASRKDS